MIEELASKSGITRESEAAAQRPFLTLFLQYRYKIYEISKRRLSPKIRRSNISRVYDSHDLSSSRR
jgi:hypothetical protein